MDMDFESLPDELKMEVLLRMDDKDILSFCQTGSSTKIICDQDYFWILLSKYRYGLKTDTFLNYNRYMNSRDKYFSLRESLSSTWAQRTISKYGINYDDFVNELQDSNPEAVYNLFYWASEAYDKLGISFIDFKRIIRLNPQYNLGLIFYKLYSQKKEFKYNDFLRIYVKSITCDKTSGQKLAECALLYREYSLLNPTQLSME